MFTDSVKKYLPRGSKFAVCTAFIKSEQFIFLSFSCSETKPSGYRYKVATIYCFTAEVPEDVLPVKDNSEIRATPPPEEESPAEVDNTEKKTAAGSHAPEFTQLSPKSDILDGTTLN